ncbi:hypothetical protein ACOSQ3_011079 [Xanthoceras sorbifolium]
MLQMPYLSAGNSGAEVEKCCRFHEDSTPRICSIKGMESPETASVGLNDGQKLCLQCLESAIIYTNQCQLLDVDVQEFYKVEISPTLVLGSCSLPEETFIS